MIALWVKPGIPAGPNRAVEVDTGTREVVWEFELAGVRDADRLPNGNTLITGGIHMVEVTPDGEVVWRLGVRGVTLAKRDHGRWFYKAERIGTIVQ